MTVSHGVEGQLTSEARICICSDIKALKKCRCGTICSYSFPGSCEYVPTILTKILILTKVFKNELLACVPRLIILCECVPYFFWSLGLICISLCPQNVQAESATESSLIPESQEELPIGR